MRNCLLFLLAVCIGASLAFAQRISGELRLQVTDPAGGSIRAAGGIVGEATGVNRTFDTDDTGRFTFRALPPGRYELTVRSEGFASKTELIQIESQLPLERVVGLQLIPLSTTIDVKDVDTLLDPIRTADYLPHSALEDRVSASPNRAVINLVNAEPGWLLEANGTLHPRGSEYDVQYVVDGVPLYDNRSPAFAQSVNIEEFQSLNVRTAGYPAEFGLKLGGVIEAASDQDAHPGFHGKASLQGGSFDNRAGSLSVRYGHRGTSVSVTGDAMATGRYLDPPVEQNYTNHGSGGGFSSVFDREWSATDHTRVYANHRKTTFMVPNELLQELAGQRQDRNGGETFGQVSHTHVFSPHLLGQFRAMARDTNARLWSNNLSTPIQPAQDRGFREEYVAGSIAAHYGRHELKAGLEGWFSSIREDLTFHIATYRLGTVRIFDRDIPQDFHFHGTSPGRTQSAFMQDAWHLGNFSLNTGLRFDHYILIAREHAWSPRIGAAYDFAHIGLVLRASYDRVFQIPAVENILFASSDLSATLGGGAFLPLLPSHGNFFETGFSKSVSPRVRIDGSWYRRSFDNFADDSLLLNTGLGFPITFSHATVRGFESKIEIRSLGPFSGHVSYSNMVGNGWLPVAGGLFLGDNARDLLEGKGSFPISQDQRNTFRSQLRFQPRPRVWAAFAGSYNSGLPFEIDGPSDAGFLAQQYGTQILGRVNFSRGRIRPSSSLDVSGGVELVHSEKMRLHLQADVFNLTNRLNVINFAGVFSGTAVDLPRSFTLRMRSEF
ncbi:MAG TPA: TonB-dependent receptor [Terriglobia bacterium]|nr:TonB-dependent receptor [Terriglobia bacterium]